MIDSKSQIPQNYTLDNLRFQTHTGRAERISGSGRDAKYNYRSGIVCPLGDVAINLWQELVLEAIESEGSMELYEHLKQWLKESCAWLHTKKEVEQYALECFSLRLYDNPLWVYYDAFNKKFRPDVAGEKTAIKSWSSARSAEASVGKE